MSVSAEEVRRIAALAHLRLSEPEVQSMSEQLSSILEHMDELRRVDVAGIPPVGGVVQWSAPLRDDVNGADPLHRPPHELAPEWTDGFFRVPRLAALDADARVPEDPEEPS